MPSRSSRPEPKRPRPRGDASGRGTKNGGRKTSGSGRSGPKAAGKGTNGRSFLWRARRALFLIALLGVAGIAGAGFVLAQVPLPPEDPPVQTTFICAADVDAACGADNAMAKLAGVEDRVSLPLEEMPQVLIEAVLAAEDRQFFSHGGIDPIGIARALYRDLRSDGVRQGGSTITQQYAKNQFLTSERTVSRKLKEAVLAIKLEREFSKEEILERYLNAVYFGRGAYGAEAAARAYYGISIRQVSLPQAAYLAALVRSPETAEATRDTDTATFRRDSVLRGMREQGWIDDAEFDAAKATPVTQGVLARAARDGVTMLRGEDAGATYFVEYVRRLLYDKYGAEKVNGGGLRVYTSLDLDAQRSAHDAVWGLLDQPTDPAGSLVSVDELGRVVAMVGGRDFDTSQVNLALGARGGGTGRQPGSTFKPIVLATALEKGLSAESRFMNQNTRVFPRADAGKDWEVSNYSEGAEGVIDLIEATRVSSNTVFAQLMIEVGPVAAVEMARELGVFSELPAVNSLVLGSGAVSVLDMANAYSTFARRGLSIEPILITRVEQVVDGEVRVLESASTKSSRPISTETADEVNWMLRQVVLGGTGTGANFGIPIAGKTGTTQNYRDAWFVGYTPRLTTAVWMGFPDPDASGEIPAMTNVRGRQVTGGSFPADIWRRFMAAVLAGESHGSFADPGPFGGDILNPDLTTPTLPCPEGGEGATSTTGSGGEAPEPSDPCPTTDGEPGGGDGGGDDDGDGGGGGGGDGGGGPTTTGGGTSTTTTKPGKDPKETTTTSGDFDVGE